MRTLLLTVSVLALLAGCRKDGEPADAGGARPLRVVKYAPASIDPGASRDQQGRALIEDLFEGLLARSAAGVPGAGAATAWSAAPDGLSWTFTLRPNLVWSDGTPLTAEDWVWSLRRALLPETANPQAEMLWPIKNARALNEGKLAAGQDLGVSAPRPDTLVIALERPYPLLPRLMSTAYAMPVPRHVVEKHGKDWTRPEHMVSNGPYVLKEHKNEQAMVLERNPKFHDAAGVAIESVSIRFTKNLDDARKWFELGEVDWVDNLLTSDAVRELKGRPELRVDDYDGVSYLLLNNARPPFDDVLVRRAFDLGIDRERLARQLLGGGEKAAVMPIPPGMTTLRPASRVRYDPAKARALLAEAGYGPSRPFPAVELAFNTNERNKLLCEFYQRNLHEALGVDVRLTAMEWGSFLARAESRDYGIAQLQLVGGLDALEPLDMLTTGSVANRPHYANPEFDAIVEKVRRAGTLAERDQAIAQGLAVLDRDVPLLSVFTLTAKALLKPGLEGYEANSDNLHPIRWMRFAERP